MRHDSVILAAVHLAPLASITVAVALSAMLSWYLIRVGRADVPPSRRRIRRFSIVVMLVSLPVFVRGLSFIDPATDQRAYVTTWTLATFLVLVVIATAIMDAVNNLRLHQSQRRDAMHTAAIDLAKAMHAHRSAPARAQRSRDDGEVTS